MTALLVLLSLWCLVLTVAVLRLARLVRHAVFTEHGTCQSHEPTRTHARRATENTWGPDL